LKGRQALVAIAVISAALVVLALIADAKSPVAWAFSAGYLAGAIVVVTRRRVVIGARALSLVAGVDLLGVTASLALHNWDRIGLKLAVVLLNAALLVACNRALVASRGSQHAQPR
jgi:peptidoglycan/LPS O-acetylase OafA/YrhL